jgi:hypothetical protein
MEAKDYLEIALNNQTRALFVSFIECLEDIKRQHNSSMFKLMENLPEEHRGKVIQASFFDEEAYQHFRKVALDHGNATIRMNNNELNKFKIDFLRDV